MRKNRHFPMALSGGMLIYLEFWGLMSRGYTLGILLTLLDAERPLTETEIASRYRAARAWTGSCGIALAECWP